jgi:hypothetical protein
MESLNILRIVQDEGSDWLYVPLTLPPFKLLESSANVDTFKKSIEKEKLEEGLAAASKLLTRRWECIPGVAFPPSFFPELQLSLLQHSNSFGSEREHELRLPMMSRLRNRERANFPKYSNVVQISTMQSSHALIVFLLSSRSIPQELRVLAWGSDVQDLQLLFGDIVNLIEMEIKKYPGLRNTEVFRKTLCPHTFDAKDPASSIQLRFNEQGDKDWLGPFPPIDSNNSNESAKKFLKKHRYHDDDKAFYYPISQWSVPPNKKNQRFGLGKEFTDQDLFFKGVEQTPGNRSGDTIR